MILVFWFIISVDHLLWHVNSMPSNLVCFLSFLDILLSSGISIIHPNSSIVSNWIWLPLSNYPGFFLDASIYLEVWVNIASTQAYHFQNFYSLFVVLSCLNQAINTLFWNNSVIFPCVFHTGRAFHRNFFFKFSIWEGHFNIHYYRYKTEMDLWTWSHSWLVSSLQIDTGHLTVPECYKPCMVCTIEFTYILNTIYLEL